MRRGKESWREGTRKGKEIWREGTRRGKKSWRVGGGGRKESWRGEGELEGVGGGKERWREGDEEGETKDNSLSPLTLRVRLGPCANHIQRKGLFQEQDPHYVLSGQLW